MESCQIEPLWNCWAPTTPSFSKVWLRLAYHNGINGFLLSCYNKNLYIVSITDNEYLHVWLLQIAHVPAPILKILEMEDIGERILEKPELRRKLEPVQRRASEDSNQSIQKTSLLQDKLNQEKRLQEPQWKEKLEKEKRMREEETRKKERKEAERDEDRKKKKRIRIKRWL